MLILSATKKEKTNQRNQEYVSAGGNTFFRGSERTIASLPGHLMNGLHSPHLGRGGTERPGCPQSSRRAFPWHKVNDLVCVKCLSQLEERAQGENHLHSRRQDKKGGAQVDLSAAQKLKRRSLYPQLYRHWLTLTSVLLQESLVD